MAIASGSPGAESKRIHFTITTLYEALMDAGVWPAGLKAALRMIGAPAGVPREPVGPLAPEAEQKLRRILQELQILPAYNPTQHNPSGALASSSRPSS
jgi:4-hydroxy-tetrahydrodipicolinate synthase